ncbi:MAG TPA: adenylate/guanylate cyclase domain-containing protein [Bryobacteraceae bacterium]|nr:adenylate/guanylate cyclase domain-containing protein [Bryobacteraceae bacterium]
MRRASAPPFPTEGSPLYTPATRKKLCLAVAVLSTLIASLVWGLSASGTLDWLENRTSDIRARATVSPPGDSNIVIVDIDNTSFRVLTDKLGRWPWTRRVWTELVRYLAPGKPKLILFDALFSGKEEAADPGFADVMRSAGNVILPFAFVSGHAETIQGGLAPPAIAALPTEITGGLVLDQAHWSLNVPEPLLLAAAAGSGSILWTPDPDGVTRRLPLTMRYGDRDYATLWTEAAIKVLGNIHAIHLPLDSAGNYVVKWHGDTLTSYKRVPLWEMICSIYPEQCDASVKRHSPGEFAGKIVFIGATAAGSYEVRPTAVSETAPGVFVLATALDNLLHSEGIRRVPGGLTLALILLCTALPAWGIVTWRSILAPLTLTLSLIGLYIAVSFFAYAHGSWLPVTAPLTAAALSFTGNMVYRYLTVDRELSRTRGTLERYVSPQLVGYVMDHIGQFDFRGEKKTLTVMFTDVRSFTTLTEKSDPIMLLAQLNEYLEAMTDIIFRHDGIVDKFIGDGIMAHWGAFTPDRPNAHLAARAALEMMTTLADLNNRWQAAGKPPLDIGVGLNTAEVIFGNVGTGKKVDFTAIGDGVNLASRLEGANKEYKTHIIISDTTRDELGASADVRPLGSIVVKGKTVGVEIFELLALNSG